MPNLGKFLLVMMLSSVYSHSSSACFSADPELYVNVKGLVSRADRIYRVQIIRQLNTLEGYPLCEPVPEGLVLNRTQGDAWADWLVNEFGGYSVPFLVLVTDNIKGSGPIKGIVFGKRTVTIAEHNRRFAGLLRPDGSSFGPKTEQEALALNRDFENHNDPEFWGGRPRTYAYPDCQMHPDYFIRSSYLLFYGPQHIKGYERTETPQDVWLAYIKGWVAALGASSDR
ncbi:MAG: hypothetical protein JKY60_17600 [Kordiimonadaceae bacterium]|nr:hypothetical protein [Kordiimonadaceae bacterium]